MQLVPDMPAHVYHQDAAMSKGKLDWFDDSPALYAYNISQGDDWFVETPIMYLGTLTHARLLEPETIKVEPVKPAVDMRLKANHGARDEYRAAYAEYVADSRPLGCTQEQYDTASGMADSLAKLKGMRTFLDTCQYEVSAFWKHELGVECRCRPDMLDVQTHALGIDIKTTHSIKPRAFQKTLTDFRYHVTEAWYTDGIKATTDTSVSYLFAVVERAPPYLAAWYSLEPRAVELGRREYLKNLQDYQKCLETDTWPGPVRDDVNEIDLPFWKYNEE